MLKLQLAALKSHPLGEGEPPGSADVTDHRPGRVVMQTVFRGAPQSSTCSWANKFAADLLAQV